MGHSDSCTVAPSRARPVRAGMAALETENKGGSGESVRTRKDGSRSTRDSRCPPCVVASFRGARKKIARVSVLFRAFGSSRYPAEPRRRAKHFQQIRRAKKEAPRGALTPPGRIRGDCAGVGCSFPLPNNVLVGSRCYLSRSGIFLCLPLSLGALFAAPGACFAGVPHHAPEIRRGGPAFHEPRGRQRQLPQRAFRSRGGHLDAASCHRRDHLTRGFACGEGLEVRNKGPAN